MAANVARTAMETYALLVLFAVTGVSLSKKAATPELEIQPPGTIRQGDNVTITCTVHKEKRLNFIRIVRIIGDVPYEISTNSMLKDPFAETGRYRVLKYSSQGGVTQTQLRIDNIQGRDGGRFGCLLLPQDLGAFEEITVLVPPKSVKLTYLRTDDVEQEVHPGGTLQMRYGVESAIYCRIYMDGNDKAPKTGIDFDGKDMTSTFIKDFTANDGADEDGFQAKTYNATFKYLTENPNKDDNGKQVTCSSKMPHFPPVIAKAKLEILYPPGLQCTQRLYANIGTQDVKISCKGKMHPAPIRSLWSFRNGSNKTTLASGEQEGEFVAVEQALGGDEYLLSITIKEVEEEHFTNYHLKVTNGIGDEKVSLVRLVKEEAKNAGQDSNAGGIRDGTNPPISPEESRVHGSAMRPAVSLAILLAVFSVDAMTRVL